MAPQTCGGGGATGLCGCTPITACPTGKVCGSYPNGCGGTITCGTCSSGKTCNGANACVCAPNAYLCSGATLLRCAVDGSDYASVATCPSASLCDASLGRCTECTPSSYYCVGADRYSCSSVGIGSKVATCINAALCASGSGASCGTPVCATDEKTCSGSTARTCNATRTGWVDEACAIGCAAGSCIKVSTLADGSGQHMCVALTNGTVRCWGATADGATGDAPLPHNKPVPVSGLTSIAQVVIAQGRSGARRSDGTLLWWGRVYSSTEPSGVIIKTPATIPGVTSTTSMSLGWFSACGVKTDGTIVCYGKGPLGDSTANAFDPAKANPYLTGILSVAQSSGTFGFALSGSDARGWGYDSWGVLGTGSTTDHLIPVSTFGGAIQIAPGGNHTCALILGGGVRCSGNNDYGQLGDNTLTTNNSPVDVTGVGAAKATQICSGSIHSCARLDDSTVKCWGANNRGQLGDGTKTNRKMATAVLGLTGATKVACGYNASCALMSDGLVKCWGSNAEGELGDGTTLTERLTPWPVAW
ncbi:MAG: hypothetical protein HYV09_36155 [Deltaproteobacteria bacterium]|nr:hypothetical protein [Deltaproteobacteria bacterium]